MISSDDQKEFDWTSEDFERVRKIIYGRAGISLNEGKSAMVYSRLSRRLRAINQTSFKSYLDLLERSGDSQEWQEFINCLTTNLTAFFRESHHFEILQEHLATQKPAGSQWKIWCNAASTGEEPYSIAITSMQALGAAGSVKITASDIDSKVLETASRGVYAMEQLKNMDTSLIHRYFQKGVGANAGKVRIKPEVRKLIDYQNVNLVSDSFAIKETFDIIFCRNVMIYFDAGTQRKVLERMHKVLKPGGLLFAGHSENFGDSKDLFQLRGKTVYERV